MRFKGIGKPEKFDTIILSDNSGYTLWKKVRNVFYKDGNSYIGISLLDNEHLKRETITISDVAVYENFGKEDKIIDKYVFTKSSNSLYGIKIISTNENIGLNELIKNLRTADGVKLSTNRLYKLAATGEEVQIIDFYRDEIIFRTKNPLLIESIPKGAIKIFKYN